MGAPLLRFTLAHDAPSPASDTERREIIQDRLDSGFYQQPDVLLETATRLLADLMSGDPFEAPVSDEVLDQRER